MDPYEPPRFRPRNRSWLQKMLKRLSRKSLVPDLKDSAVRTDTQSLDISRTARLFAPGLFLMNPWVARPHNFRVYPIDMPPQERLRSFEEDERRRKMT